MDDKGTPFLAYVLDFLIKQGIAHIVLSVGYKAEVIHQYFGSNYCGIPVDYVEESSPLGTGGAVKKALTRCQDENVFVLNGDTYFDVNLVEMRGIHEKCKADFTLAAKKMYDFDRYGTLQLDDAGRVVGFAEKKYCVQGYINGGIYYMRKKLLDDVSEEKFSIEKDFLEKCLEEIRIQAFFSEEYFIDIGIPEDYEQARKYWKAKSLSAYNAFVRGNI